MAYTMRRTWPQEPDAPDDFVILHDKKDAGRIFKTLGIGGTDVWQWTIYGTSKAGREPTLEAAKARWRAALNSPRKFGWEPPPAVLRLLSAPAESRE